MMQPSIYNKREVPSVHPGCSLAETGWNDYDDFDNPLGPMNIIPKAKIETLLEEVAIPYKFDGERYVDITYKLSPEIKSPSEVRDEPHVKVIVPSGVHPFVFLMENGSIDIKNSWVFMNKDVVDVLRRMPCRCHQASMAYGEFFRFENFNEIVLQDVSHFSWGIIREGKLNGEIFDRPDIPQTIIEVVLAE